MNTVVIHAKALAQVKKYGGRCQITKATTILDGYATPLVPAVNEFAALGLDTKANVKLFWVPVTRGQVPVKGATFTWSGTVYGVEQPNPYDPDNTGALYCELIGSR